MRKELNTDDDQQDAQHQQWMAILNIAVFIAQKSDVRADQTSDQGRNHAQAPECMHGRVHKAHNKRNGHQVQQPAQQAPGTEFRLAE